MADFTEADVEAVVRVCRMYAPSAESDVYPMADQILAAVVPAMRDRWLEEVAGKLRRNLDEHPRRGTQEWRTGYDDAAFWLLAQRSGGDQ